MKRNASKLIVIGIVALPAFILFASDLGQYLTPDYVKARQQAFDACYAEHTGLTIAICMIIQVMSHISKSSGELIFSCD
ncbi:MAG: hypothetical protein B6245_16530 [Desulfobacteraceae bacterium 4572_88]|nr:MAG: hypothetical protein B6245_16530 [Desulfobacteraceae bacterium 4572_88]